LEQRLDGEEHAVEAEARKWFESHQRRLLLAYSAKGPNELTVSGWFSGEKEEHELKIEVNIRAGRVVDSLPFNKPFSCSARATRRPGDKLCGRSLHRGK